MWRSARVCACVSALLLQVNVVLAAYAGAGLVLAARLRWDPSLYVVTRAMFPREHAASSAALPALAAAALLLAHAAAAAALSTAASSRRRLLLHIHTWGTLAVLVAGGLWLGWLARRLQAWAASPAAAPARDAAAAADHLQPLLDLLAKYLPLPGTLQDIIRELKDDVPLLAGAARAGGALLAALLLLSALLSAALLCAEGDKNVSEKERLRLQDETERLAVT